MSAGTITAAIMADAMREQVFERVKLYDSVEQRKKVGMVLAGDLFRFTLAGPVDDTGIHWSADTDVGTATSFTPGGTYPPPEACAYDKAALDVKGLVIGARISNDVIDRLNSGSDVLIAAAGDAIAETMNHKTDALMLELETQLAGSGAGTDIQGIQSIIQASTTYANMDQSALAYVQPYIDSASAVWSFSKMDAFLESYREPTRNGNGRVAITGRQQWNKIKNKFQDNNPTQYVSTQQLVAGATGLVYEEAGIFKVPGYSTSRMDMFDPSEFEIAVLRQVRVEEKASEGDWRNFVITLTAALKHKNPKNTGAMTALT